MKIDKKVLAIIPARAGSKRIPNKNIVDLDGYPLIAYTIAAARSSSVFDKIIVSTDSAEIALLSESLGAEVPGLRPECLATDTSSSLAVVEHALNQLSDKNGFSPDVIVLLQPTSPLRQAEQITEAVSRFSSDFHRIDSLVGVSEVTQHPEWMYTIDADSERLTKCYSEANKYQRTQDLIGRYYINGAIYITKRKTLLATSSLFGGRVAGYIMDEESSIDIDTPRDLMIAEILISERKKSEKRRMLDE